MLCLSLALFFTAATVYAQTSGTFTAVGYNVAGLPPILNDNGVYNKASAAILIGQKFKQGGYDIINVQEDFAFNQELYSQATLPYRTKSSGNVPIGSGLNTLSNFPFADLDRVKWDQCFINSADCLTPKGFTYVRVRLAPGVFVDVYNLHGDAGDDEGDFRARRSNVDQLVNYINANSVGNAVLVYGDTNTRYTSAGDNVRNLGTRAGLIDVWVQLQKGGVPPAVNSTVDECDVPAATDTCEAVDKSFYRSSPLLTLTPTAFRYLGKQFLAANGSILADHNPTYVSYTWSQPGLRQSDYIGGATGAQFNDASAIGNKAAVKAVALGASATGTLASIRVDLASGQALAHGGAAATTRSLTLAAGETLASGVFCPAAGLGTALAYAQLKTSAGRTLEVGRRPAAGCVAAAAPAGFAVAGFAGRAARGLGGVAQLAALYARV